MPVNETLHITKLILDLTIILKNLRQIITVLYAILKQFYFQFANNFDKPNKGVAMEPLFKV
jgi:hypothetical protein